MTILNSGLGVKCHIDIKLFLFYLYPRFEESSRQLISNIQNIEHVLADVCLVQFVERDEEKTSLEDLKARLFGWLQTHVQK